MNETPVIDNLVDETSVQSRNKLELAYSNRVLRYAFLASIVVNLVWLALVSHSDLFGKSGAPLMLHEKPIKVFKPIPVKPKPKQVKPPPPPPKPPKVQPKIKPIEHPHPTPPRPTPTRQIAVAHTNNAHAINTMTVPDVAPSDNQAPVNPGPPSPPAPVAPPAPPAPVTTPAPVAVTPPTPPAPKPEPKPTPPPPPPPVVHPRNYSPVPSQEAGPIGGNYEQPTIPDGVDPSALSNTSITVEWEIDENGHVSNLHVSRGSGNSDLDQACLEAIRRTKFQPAIQDHIKLREPGSYTFNVGS